MPEFVLEPDQWPRMPGAHRDFLESVIPRLRADPRLAGLAAGGSFVTDGLDEYSDLDLIVVAYPDAYEDVLRKGSALAGHLGPLLAAFLGDHVGEPRLLICLYGPPLLHVDLKFLSSQDLAHRVEDPGVLWDRDGQVRLGLSQGRATYPQPNLQWIEDRFWVWVHYTIVKIARGELFEALDALAIIRRRVLGPLILLKSGRQPDGVRRVESSAPAFVPRLRSTVGAHDRTSCRDALVAAIALYTDLRERLAPSALLRRVEAERAARNFLQDQLR
ncbi:MAG: oxalate:formate antiporter [Armatimonadota bacterium]